MDRTNISQQLEKSLTPQSIIKTGANNEAQYLAPGSNGQVLTIVSGAAQWSTPSTGSSFSITDGTNTQIVSAGDTVSLRANDGLHVVVGATDEIVYGIKYSADYGNVATTGSDGGLYVPVANIVTGATWNDATNTIVITFQDNSVVNVPIVDNIGQWLADFSISDGTNTTLINNHGTVTYVGLNKITTKVTGNQLDIRLDTTGSTNGQVLTSTGDGNVPEWRTVSGGSSSCIIGKPWHQDFDPLPGETTIHLDYPPVTNYAYTTVRRNGIRARQNIDYSIVGQDIVFTIPFNASSGAAYSETADVDYHIACDTVTS